MRIAVLLAFGLAVACDAQAPSPEASAPATAAATAPAAADPLLASASASIHGGELDPQIERQLMDSTEPQHARARRILRFMANESDTPEPAAKSAPKPVAASASTGAAGTQPKPTVSVVAPPQDSPEDPADHTKPGVQRPKPKAAATGASGESSNDSGNGSSRDSSGEAHQAPRLALLTRLRLSGTASKVTLRLNAANRVVMGMAEQPQSGLVRLVIESAGALPAFLQARPESHGVKVIDVRRGEDTVQISVELQPGWEARGPRSGADGASIDFVKP